MLVRNVGMHMTTDALRFTNAENTPAFEGVLDAFVTCLISLHDFTRKKNSRHESIYIVKPKLHGPDEVAFSVKIFAAVEQALGLQNGQIKIGIMDEERRTSANLAACIKAAQDRVIFINTGFLDRTGDEIHTSMQAGAVLPKAEIKHQKWISAYEALNVKTGLACGFYKKAQIGKGMWAQPDLMKAMLETKIAHLQAGASCSWVPSPTAATLHAIHYHQVDVQAKQQEIMQDNQKPNKDDLLLPPLCKEQITDQRAIQKELENNIQGILGYVVRWIDQGIGCSKVADIDNVQLMEDRATLRISSQHVANWLAHGVCSKEQVQRVFEKMAVIVDSQNAQDPLYKNMAPDYNSHAYQAALALAFEGAEQANGYTEDILNSYRRKVLEEGEGTGD